MPSAQLPADLQTKIEHARRLRNRPVESRFSEPATVAETLYLRAANQPEAPFLTYLAEDGALRSYSYAEFYRAVRRIAAMLHIFAGVKAGDRIATAMHNHDQTILVNFAAWHLGATVVPLNMAEDDKRLAYILEHSRAKVLFALSEHLERARALRRVADSIEQFIITDGIPSHCERGEVCLHDVVLPVDVPQFAKPATVTPEAEALIVYTSGTTGMPKGVVLSQYNLVADAYSIAQWHQLSPGNQMMCVLPVHHVNGLVVTHIAPMFSGGSVVLRQKFVADDFFEIVRKHSVQVVSVVPTLLQFLLEAHTRAGSHGDLARKLAPTLRHLICGAGPLTVDLAARFEDRFGVPICHGYGLSETTCYSCFVPLPASTEDGVTEHQRWMRDFGYPSIGLPVSTNEMAIHDDGGRALPEGEKGEIVIRGHNVMLGYHDNVSANQNAFTHGWFRSGDEGFFKTDARGQSYFFISGRYKELIIRGGVKISPLELDEVLCGIPGVKAAMAVGFENVTYGEEVGAYVVPQPGSGLTAEAVLSACRARMPSWMCPKAVVFGEKFPVTSTGKYQRNQLKPLFAARTLEVQTSKDEDAKHVAAHDAIEAELLKLWKQTMGVSKVAITDDFFALGGNSMIAASIISRIEQRFGKNLPLATFFQTPTIAGIAALLRKEGWKPSWSSLVPMQTKGSRPPFYCVHPVGGNVLCYHDLARGLGEDQPVYGLQAPGLDGEQGFDFCIEDLARQHVREIRQFQSDGPYYLGGASMGGLVAFEIAQQLVEQGAEVGLLALFDTPGPHSVPVSGRRYLRSSLQRMMEVLDNHIGNLARLTPGEAAVYLLRELRWLRFRALEKASGLFGGSSLVSDTLMKIEAGARAARERYAVRPYRGRVTLFRASHYSQEFRPDPHLGWDGIALDGLEVFEVPGYHSSIFIAPRVCVLADHLRDCIEKVQAATRDRNTTK
ncbi:MAG TPA: AMP-binding protein [Planctomycetota bacterium]|jgi:long-chain acyl-CoA synthetase